MTVGFFYVSILTLVSIAGLLDWIFSLNAPKWVSLILGILAFGLWISGLAFIQEAETALLTKRKKEKNNDGRTERT